ncbi:hypothetical protein R3I94_014388 [Phoxinus phoxinus]
MTQRGLQETDSEEDSSSQSQDEDNYAKHTSIKGQASKTLVLSIESEEGMEGGTDGKPQRISEVSADLELLPPRSHKHNNDSTTGGKNHVHKRVKFADKRSEVDIESFSSSEDEVPQKGVRCTKGPSPQENKSTHRRSSGKDNTTQMSLGIKSRNTLGSNKTQSRDEGNTGTLDSLLGGLQHVSYTHSNQKVVGSSRAEDRLSRAAVRDVFELNKHSQLPANQILDSSEASTQSSDPVPADHGDGGQTPLAYGRPHMEHPVTHTIKTSYRQNNVTVIVGETPSSMCRQQLEEMAQFFGFDTVRDFAEDILKNDSEQRLSRLRSFYSQESPELKNIIEKTFPKPDVEPKPPTSPPPSRARQRTTSKRVHRNSPLKPQVEVPTLEITDQREPSKKKRMGKPETSEVHLHCSADLIDNTMKMSSTDKYPSSSSGHLSQRCSAPVEETKTNIISSSQPFKNKKCTSRSPLVSTDDCAASSSTQTSSSSKITDLIGDTSILNDLFTSKKKTVDQPRDVKTSTCTERAKSRGKDFWDILNEGNVESINKLTDLTEVEKICNSVSVSAKSRSNEKTESPQLWKKNEKFLWKH